MGSGSTWRRPSDGKLVINWSENYCCAPATAAGRRPQPTQCGGSAGLCQHIHFATSSNGLVWERVPADTFEPDMRWYATNFSATQEARWDTINTLPKEDGSGLWGYWTASPLSGNGAGFGETVGGSLTKWRALPPVLGLGGEVGAVARIGGRVWAIAHGVLGVADNATGPFGPPARNPNLCSDSFGVFFARFWPVHNDPEGTVLVSHQHCAVPGGYHTSPVCHLGLLKQAKLNARGALQAVWWPRNDRLRGEPIPLRLSASIADGLAMLQPLSHPPPNDIFDGPGPGQFELRGSGVMIEGSILRAGSAGNVTWFVECVPNGTSPRDGGSSVDMDGFGVAWVGATQTFEAGPISRLGHFRKDMGDSAPWATFDRDMRLPADATASWKLLLRSFRGDASAPSYMPISTSPGYTMAELFIDDVMMQPVTLPCLASGAVGIRGGSGAAKRRAGAAAGEYVVAHYLTL